MCCLDLTNVKVRKAYVRAASTQRLRFENPRFSTLAWARCSPPRENSVFPSPFHFGARTTSCKKPRRRLYSAQGGGAGVSTSPRPPSGTPLGFPPFHHGHKPPHPILETPRFPTFARYARSLPSAVGICVCAPVLFRKRKDTQSGGRVRAPK